MAVLESVEEQRVKRKRTYCKERRLSVRKFRPKNYGRRESTMMAAIMRFDGFGIAVGALDSEFFHELVHCRSTDPELDRGRSDLSTTSVESSKDHVPLH